MTFQSLEFLAFFAVVLAVCLLLGRKHPLLGRTALGVANLVFYLWSFNGHTAAGFCVLAVGTAATGFAGRAIFRAADPRRRRGFLAAAVCWHTAVLLVFKYTGFFTGGTVNIGWAPLGLSFFTFQQIWYLKEVYTGQWKAEPLLSLCLYSFFFPTVSSGPILRPDDFFPQLTGPGFLQPTWEDAAAGLYAFSIGLAKKILLADSFSIAVGNGWENIGSLHAPDAWMVILGYTLQLYFDFSGYCDMAAGVARLLGIRLPVNFDSPYRSLSVSEFWKRWHITLTSFLRECIYFPLGGSRRGKIRTYVNIMVIFLISGFWHGAGWTFLVWGAFHGLCQVVERLWGERRNRLPVFLRWAVTFLLVNIAWVFFRAPDLSGAFAMLKTAVCGGFSMPQSFLFDGIFKAEIRAVHVLIPALAGRIDLIRTGMLYGVGLLAVLLPGNTIRRMDTFRPTFRRGLAVCLLFVWSVLSMTGITTFIYSNF